MSAAQHGGGVRQPAELKLHAVYSVNAGSAISVGISSGSVHDSDGFAPQNWQAGALYIWDLGYNSYDRLVDAVLGDAQALQRLKQRANPVVVASYGPTGCRQLVLDHHGKPVRLNDAFSPPRSVPKLTASDSRQLRE